MMRRFLFICLAALLCVFARAQITFGPSIPLGSFGSCDPDDGELFFLDGSKNGGADIGTALGLHINGMNAIETGLFWDFSLDFFWNPLCSDARDFMDDVMGKVDYKLPYHFNFCNLLGIGYQFAFSEKNSLFLQGSVGYDIRTIGDFKYGTYDWDNSIMPAYKNQWHFKTACGFAFMVGGGVRLSEKTDLSVRYYNLGSRKVKGEVWHLDHQKFTWKKVNPQMLVIALGINI